MVETKFKTENKVIEELTKKTTKSGKIYYSLKAGGLSYSVWEGNETYPNSAYSKLEGRDFDVGSAITIHYTKTPGKNAIGGDIEYKNIFDLEQGDLNQEYEKNKSYSNDDKMSKEEWAQKDRRISRMNCISNALEFCKLNQEQINNDLKNSPDKIINTSFVLGIAKEFEKYIYFESDNK